MGNSMADWRLAIVATASCVLGIVATLLAMASGLFDRRAPKPPTTEWGTFSGTPKVELLNDGLDLRLLDDFVYTDPRAKPWVARKNTVSNGASIPRVFWTIVGAPLTSQYRNASIIHDAECERMATPWEDVHFMFYEASRCGGVPENQAKVMFAAVYHFGPRWETKVVMETKMVIESAGKQRPVPVYVNAPKRLPTPPEPDAGVRAKLEKYIKERNPSVEELKKLNPAGI